MNSKHTEKHPELRQILQLLQHAADTRKVILVLRTKQSVLRSPFRGSIRDPCKHLCPCSGRTPCLGGAGAATKYDIIELQCNCLKFRHLDSEPLETLTVPVVETLLALRISKNVVLFDYIGHVI